MNTIQFFELQEFVTKAVKASGKHFDVVSQFKPFVPYKAHIDVYGNYSDIRLSDGDAYLDIYLVPSNSFMILE
jgi:hypothetical protein